MSEEQEQPRWELLPDQPVAFFGLEPGFDRKDLKRAYNELIRRFKPERFPEEFQRIRAAFETVDDGLRYGTLDADAPEGAVEAAFERSPAGEADPEAAAPVTPAPPDVLELLQAESPRSVYDTLRNRADRSARDYYALAVLSDAVPELADPEAGTDFFGWVCQGLEACPGSPHLVRLLYAYCHDAGELDDPRAVLERLSRILATGEFGYVTERLWLRLVGTDPFEEVLEFLNQCWRNARDRDVLSRVSLLLPILRRSMFVAPLDWLQERLKYLWENFDEAYQSEQDLEFLEVLLGYQLERDEFLDGNAARAEIDAVIRAICEEDEPDADRAFLAWRVSRRSQGARFLDAFRYDEELGQSAVQVLRWYSYQVDERVEGASPALSEPQQRRVAVEFARRLNKLTDGSMRGKVHHLSVTFLMILVPLMLFVLSVGLSSELEERGFNRFVTLIPMLAAFAGLFWFVFRPYVVGPIVRHQIRKAYQKIWRKEVLGLLSREPISSLQLAQALYQQTKEFTDADDAANFLAVDNGISIVSLVRHRR